MTKNHPSHVGLLTGATGFVGSRLAAHLARAGWKLHVLVRPTSDWRVLERLSPPVAFHTWDGATPESLRSLLESVRPCVVFHLAGHIVPEETTEDIDGLVQGNILFGLRLLQACAEIDGPIRIVSTGSIFQKWNGIERAPLNLYGAMKQAFQDVLTYYAVKHHMAAITLRLSDVYGPGDKRNKVVPFLVEALHRSEASLLSPGEQYLSLVHVDDVAHAYCIAAERLLAGKVQGHKVFDVFGDEPIRLRDLVAALERAAECRIPVVFGGYPYRSREMMVPVAGSAKLPGWKQQISLEGGLRQLLNADAPNRTGV